MKKIINLIHHLDDYECMWNGIEDLYISKSGEQLPKNMFFSLASFGSFCYMKLNKSNIKRLVVFGDGRTKQMYEFLSPFVEFQYNHYEYPTFEKALAKAKKEIDNGYPCVLGALDMFYLPYFDKIYKQEHIPFHYILMVGYDDDLKKIYFHDCGRKELMTISYDELCSAWNCEYAGLSKPYTICKVRMGELNNKYEITKQALKKKKELFLNPPVSFLGYKGIDKFVNEFPNWKQELGEIEYKKILANFVEFLGTVPTKPNKLKGIDKPDNVKFYGGFDKIFVVLAEIGKEYNDNSLIEAGKIFYKGAEVCENIKIIIVDYLTGKEDKTHEIPMLFMKIKEIIKEGFLELDY